MSFRKFVVVLVVSAACASKQVTEDTQRIETLSTQLVAVADDMETAPEMSTKYEAAKRGRAIAQELQALCIGLQATADSDEKRTTATACVQRGRAALTLTDRFIGSYEASRGGAGVEH